MNDFEAPAPASAIAIVGMSGRFPGAKTTAAFWQNLCDGVESISFFSDDELEPSIVDAAEQSDPAYVKAKGILEDIEQFDAAFFGFSPREAALTDPQHRLFLECAWEALEDAGYEAERYEGSIGLFAGAGANNYLLFNLWANGYLTGTIGAFQAMIHNKNDHLATRAAYKLNLHGPAVNVQTACSTSLVAVHLACQSLLMYQCDMCLAGGVTISHPQRTGYLYHEGGIGSPDGHCRAFDAQAQGTVAGSGAGVVLLKRLEDAQADGDFIHAVILGSAINNDGAQKVGYTAPSMDYQADVIEMALGMAGVEADSIGYVEAHGTGTPMGDPIEVEALTRAFRTSTQRNRFCALGAVKSNIGHLDTAAGVAGLIKTVLALKHRVIPPSLYFETPNPLIDFDNSPFYLNRARADWPAASSTPRRAGVSSFGVGGTNAHLVLQEAPAPAPTGSASAPHLLLISARSDTALEQASARLASALRQQPDVALADVAWTLQGGRKAFSHRRMVVCHDVADAVATLEALTPQRVISRVQEAGHRPLTWMFPGQGAQHLRMGAELYEREPLFRAQVDRCLDELKPQMTVDLRPVWFPPAGEEAAAAALLRQTELTQPAIFVIEYALAQLWKSWGLQPQAMIGHSIGELVAAHLAGVMSLEDALALAALRGRLIQSLPPGAMLAVPLAESDCRCLLNDQLALAAVNGPALCVISGPGEAVDALERQLAEQNVSGRRLQTSHAFHSQMMEPIIGPFVEAIRRVTLHAPQLPYLSNVTGRWITAAQATDPQYWGDHIRQTVRFADGLALLLEEPDAVLLEVGPGQTLRTLARWNPHKKPNQWMLASLPHPQEQQPERAFLLNTVGHLWLTGISLNWPAFYAHEQRQRVPLPTYPWERQRFWIEAQPAEAEARLLHEEQLRKKPDPADWFYLPRWHESARPRQAGGPAIGAATWLVFVGEDGLGAQLVSRVRQTPLTLITVQPGERFHKLGEGAYEIDPRQRADYDTLLGDLRTHDRLPETIVHCWSTASETTSLLDHSFYSLLFLAQAVGSQQMTGPLQIIVLSSQMQEVVGGDGWWPEKATVMGPCLVIPREYANVTCRSVDVDLPEADSWQETRLLDQLMWELATRPSQPFVAYRNGRRWERTWEAVRVDGCEDASIGLRERGTYLITGGLGGLGLTFADFLAKQARARLVLVGRSPFPPREEWVRWLDTHDPNDRISATIERLQAMEAQGAELLVVRADVADEIQMRRVVAQAQARFGPIHGVIHAAGVPAGGVIQLKSVETASKVLAAKVQGTRVLEAIFTPTTLDFLVLCSSLTSAVGRFGQVDYTAANAFLDAFAPYYQSRTGTPTVAVNWGAWEEVGMVANTAMQAKPESNVATVQTLNHPLLERHLVDSDSQKVFATDFNVAKHWVLDEHRILGNPVIPGVTYVEMVRAALEEEAAGRFIEFQELLFIAPLRVRDGETREVRLVLQRSGDGYDFVLRSHEGEKERTYAAGKVRVQDAEPLRQYDLAAIRERCNRQTLVLPSESREEDLGPRWHSVQRVHLGTNEALIELAMPDAFAADFDQMAFHPALQDRTAGIAKDLLAPKAHYLPFTYNRLTIKSRLLPKIFSHVRYRAEDNVDGETISFDIVLMDEMGRGLVEIERFSQKRVNDPGEQIRALARMAEAPMATHASVAAPAPSAREEIRPAEGAEALRRILAWQLTPQVVVSVRDLHASIRFTDEMMVERRDGTQAQDDHPLTVRPKFPRPSLSTTFVGPRNEVEQQIATVWQEMLGIEQVGIHDNFFDLGGDSLIGIELVARLSKALDVHIPAVSLFEGPTVSALGALVGRDDDAVPTFDESQSRGTRRREKRHSRKSKMEGPDHV